MVIGGTLSTKEPDQEVVRWLRRVHPGTTWTTSVCTGSIYLAAAGILDGQDATTHWAWARERTLRRPLHRAAGGGARQGDHRRRVSLASTWP